MNCDCGGELHTFIMNHETGETTIEELCPYCDFNSIDKSYIASRSALRGATFSNIIIDEAASLTLDQLDKMISKMSAKKMIITGSSTIEAFARAVELKQRLNDEV